jgi:hypothetical protein
MSDKMAWSAWAIRRVGTDELEKNYWGLFCIYENETDAREQCESLCYDEKDEWEVVKVRITTDE